MPKSKLKTTSSNPSFVKELEIQSEICSFDPDTNMNWEYEVMDPHFTLISGDVERYAYLNWDTASTLLLEILAEIEVRGFTILTSWSRLPDLLPAAHTENFCQKAAFSRALNGSGSTNVWSPTRRQAQ